MPDEEWRAACNLQFGVIGEQPAIRKLQFGVQPGNNPKSAIRCELLGELQSSYRFPLT